MKKEVAYLILTLFFFGIVLFGIVGANYWYKVDVHKCNDIYKNDFYYSSNNCWETYNMPLLTKSTMFFLITLIPGVIGLFILWRVWDY